MAEILVGDGFNTIDIISAISQPTSYRLYPNVDELFNYESLKNYYLISGQTQQYNDFLTFLDEEIFEYHEITAENLSAVTYSMVGVLREKYTNKEISSFGYTFKWEEISLGTGLMPSFMVPTETIDETYEWAISNALTPDVKMKISTKEKLIEGVSYTLHYLTDTTKVVDRLFETNFNGDDYRGYKLIIKRVKRNMI